MATYSGTPTTAAAGNKITASLWNTDVKGFIDAFGAWNPFTPTLSQGASTDITATKACEYIRINKTCIARFRLDATAAGTAGSNITVTLPVTASGNGMIVGVGLYYDNDSTDYMGIVTAETTTTAVLSTTAGKLGTSPAVTVASGDIYYLLLAYETA